MGLIKFYAVIFVMLQGQSTVWIPKNPDTGHYQYFKEAGKCFDYLNTIEKPLMNSIMDNRLYGKDQFIIQSWCVKRKITKEEKI